MSVARFPINTLGLIPDPIAYNSDGSQDTTSLVGVAPGTIVWGDNGSAFQAVTFVGDGSAHYQGEVFSFNRDFLAVVLAATPVATDTTYTFTEVGTLFFGVQTKLAGPGVGVTTYNGGFTFVSGTTYQVWLQIKGKSMIAFDGNPVGVVWTSATAGELGHATATKAYVLNGVKANGGTVTFSGVQVSGSKVVTVASGTNYDDLLVPGVLVTGTGFGSSARIVTVAGDSTIGYTLTMSVASTASATNTGTATVIYVGQLNFPEVVSQAA